MGWEEEVQKAEEEAYLRGQRPVVLHEISAKRLAFYIPVVLALAGWPLSWSEIRAKLANVGYKTPRNMPDSLMKKFIDVPEIYQDGKRLGFGWIWSDE